MNDTATVPSNERTWAGLAHASILLGLFTNGIGGIGVALVLWITQKDKSPYAAFQAMQSLVYQVMTYILVFLLFSCWGGVWMLMLIPAILGNPEALNGAPPTVMWVGLALMVIPFGVWLLTTAYGVLGAVRCFQGHDFRYLLVGKWVGRQVGQGESND